jgi:hypothetical protein
MERAAFRTFAGVERQMKAARQLRAETVSRSSAQAIKALRDLARRMADRIRGTQDLALPH